MTTTKNTPIYLSSYIPTTPFSTNNTLKVFQNYSYLTPPNSLK